MKILGLEILKVATGFKTKFSSQPFVISAVKSSGDKKWVVEYDSLCFSKSQDRFINNLQSSERTHDFLEDTRFDSFELALDAFNVWAEKNKEHLEVFNF